MTYTQFKAKYNGKHLEYNHDKYLNQCMDMFWAYLKEVLGVNPAPFQGWGTAINCYNNFHNIKGASDIFQKISNTPNGVPTKGDIVFWGFYPGITGLAGHVAIYDGGNVWTLVSFDQNYPTGSVCHLQSHSYKGVKGWLHKK